MPAESVRSERKSTGLKEIILFQCPGLSREASTKRRSGISGNPNSFQVQGFFQWPTKALVKRIRRIHLLNIFSVVLSRR
ncbi:hypothetical protein AZE41_01045 [Sporosarcina psychrophila]|nr:hypothetical protein AZE41_01045 [Sporosarcina psychrophila]